MITAENVAACEKACFLCREKFLVEENTMELSEVSGATNRYTSYGRFNDSIHRNFQTKKSVLFHLECFRKVAGDKYMFKKEQ